MSANHNSLDAASTDRRARLAKLASLKRKQPETTPAVSTLQDDDEVPEEISKSGNYISGRNYDVSVKGPKLGFENVPSAKVDTIEEQANRITLSAREQAAKDEAEAEKGIDLFKLQPKKPNWDLKRDLAEKMKVVDIRTQNAIARLVRQRIENTKNEALQKTEKTNKLPNEEQGEEVGMDGNTLVEGVHLREREENERRNLSSEDDEDIS